MAYSREPIPSLIIKTILNDNWEDYGEEIPKPRLVDVNDGTSSQRQLIESFSQDLVLIRISQPGEQETYRDSWRYIDRVTRVELEIWTKHSRQRLYDLKQEIRRTIHSQVHSLDDYQVIRYIEFYELVDEQFNIWKGMITCSLENNRLPMET